MAKHWIGFPDQLWLGNTLVTQYDLHAEARKADYVFNLNAHMYKIYNK